MKNDLISREALKEATKNFTDCDGFNPVWQIIDNSPTVAEMTERQTGKWIKERAAFGWAMDCVKCSICGFNPTNKSYFCPFCGARMTEGME